VLGSAPASALWSEGAPVATVQLSGRLTIEDALDDIMRVESTILQWLALIIGARRRTPRNMVSGPLAGIRLNASFASSAALTPRALQGIG
jgi:hypothetical protein